MPKTIDDLLNCCLLDIIPPLPVVSDFFGLHNVEHLNIILGIYQGMLKIKGMDKSIVEKAFKKNQLDKLIHDSYKVYGISGYYRMFCEKDIKIGKTYF